MPGSDYILGGPVFWLLTGLLFVAGMLAAFVALDATRRYMRPRAGEARSAPLLVYAFPQALYVMLMLLGEVRAVPIIVTGIVVLATPLALAQGVAYLLRVVFPKAAPLEPDEDIELLADGGDTIEPESAPVHPAEPPAHSAADGEC